MTARIRVPTARLALLVATFACAALGPGLGAARAASPDVVIAQIYGSGGMPGAAYQNDFVELVNRGTVGVTLTGWSIQVAPGNGTTWSVTPLSGTIAPGRSYLVREASTSSVGVPLPTPEAAGTININPSSAKVALVTTTTALTCGASPGSCAGATLRDLVGYGTQAVDYEGSTPAPQATSVTESVHRDLGGCQDTDQNGQDLFPAPVDPRNSASSPVTCDATPEVASTTPAANASSVAADASVTVTFSEPVTVTTGWWSLVCTASGTRTATVSGGPTTYTIRPAAPFTAGESCTLTVVASEVADVDANDPPNTMDGNETVTFTVAGSGAAGGSGSGTPSTGGSTGSGSGSGGGSGGSQTSGGAGGGTARAFGLAPVGSVAFGGVVRVRLRCPSSAIDSCAGDLTLVSKKPLAGRRSARLGDAAFEVRSGRSRIVRVRLTRQARIALGRLGRLKAVVRALGSDGDGATLAARLTLTLVPPAR
ncbi:MAG: Ig-like domain-containing protein [Thermoleophilia bacterium]